MECNLAKSSAPLSVQKQPLICCFILIFQIAFTWSKTSRKDINRKVSTIEFVHHSKTFRVMTTSEYFLFMQLKTYSTKKYRYVDSNLKVYHLTIGRKVCNGVSIRQVWWWTPTSCKSASYARVTLLQRCHTDEPESLYSIVLDQTEASPRKT